MKIAGMRVSARNLTLTAPNKSLLKDLNFYLQPGKMTLLLGTPGCGKTCLFRALSGTNGRSEVLTGDLKFNGKELNQKTHHRDVSYVQQEDNHIPCYTVGNTIKFSADLQMREGSTEQEKNDRVDDILKMLDLTHTRDTIIGSEFIRGISGGQRKRVSIGIELVKDANLYLMDEPTTGLDSTTSLSIMNSIREMVDTRNVSCLISLLQPGVDIAKLFDNLMIISGGEMAYFGPMTSAISYFEDLGFQLPSHHNPAEFFQEIIDQPELFYPKEGEPPLRGTLDFVNAYRNSKNRKEPSMYYTDSYHLEEYPTTPFFQMYLNLTRGIWIEINSWQWLRVRVSKVLIMGLIIGTLFWKLDRTQADAISRQGLIFFEMMFIFFGAFGTIASIFEQRGIMEVQRSWRYYNTFSYFFATILIDLPLCILEGTIFSVLVYWMCGFRASGSHFIYFILMVVALELWASSLFRLVSSITPSSIVASTIAPIILSPFILFSGFISKVPEIPKWWIWLYWISPPHYGFEGLLINEFSGVSYTCSPQEMMPPLPIAMAAFNGSQVCPVTNGDQVLTSLDLHTQDSWKWIDLIICLAFYVVFNVAAFVALVYIRYDFVPVKKTREVDHNNTKPHKDQNASITVSAPSIRESSVASRQTGCSMQWRDLVYEVDVKKFGKKTNRLRLLNAVDGYIKPGMLLALMGPSGAGKSTLLDVLADRKTGGHISGDILVNGKPRGPSFIRSSAYVEQQDILPPMQTVRECIQLSAMVRLPEEMPVSEKQAFADYILDMLDLTPIQNMRIGDSLTPSQRKKVNIGIELSSDPQLLFLDEPTSGLDSAAAFKLISYIKRIASSGRSIICTVHQPSTSIFKQFDHLLLLKRGGQQAYFGEIGHNADVLLSYFADAGLTCDPYTNPADFILDLADSSSTFDAAAAFKRSREQEVARETIPPPVIEEGNETVYHGEYASSPFTQLRYLARRSMTNQIRNLDSMRARAVRAIALALILGTLFLRFGHDQADVFSRKSLIFFSIVLGGLSSMSIVPAMSIERGLFYREQAAKSYRVSLYMISLFMAELPLLIISVILYSVIIYFLTALRLDPHGGPFFYFTFILIGSYVNYYLLGVMLAVAMPNEEIAYTSIGTTIAITTLFGGFLLPESAMPKPWRWFNYVDLVKYPLDILHINEFRGLEFTCPNNEGAVPVPVNGGVQFFCPVTKGDQVLDFLKIDQDHLYSYIAVMFAYSMAFLFLSYLALRFFRHQVK
eukprot:gene7883-9254_t